VLFPTVTFAVFFAVVFVGHRLLLGNRRAWTWFMLVASYVFYGWWNWKFLFLIFASSIIDYLAALKIDSTVGEKARKWWLALSMTANLSILGFFKYFDFFALELANALTRLGINNTIEPLGLILPVGISFFTFQSMSYTIDVYRKRLEPVRSIPEMLVFVSFFPQLVAGPIVRARLFLDRLHDPAPLRPLDPTRAYGLILAGLFKKLVIADFLATELVQPVFSAPGNHSPLEVLLGVYGFTVQIYCDFSAYSDMAIGIAMLMGFQFPINFNKPFKAVSLQDFWRRWHISLTSWLGDYLYGSLGGSTKGVRRTMINIMLTMLLGGLWHGANWTFVLFGLIHGTGLIVEGAIRAREKAGYPGFAATIWRWSERTPVISIVTWPLRVLLCGTAFLWRPLGKYWVGDDYDHPRLLRRVFRTVLIYHFIAFTITLFRAQSVGRTVQIWSRVGDLLVDLANFDMPSPGVSKAVILVLVFGLFMDGIPSRWFHRVGVWFRTLSPVPQGLLLAAAATAIDAMAVQGVAPFLYFAF